MSKLIPAGYISKASSSENGSGNITRAATEEAETIGRVMGRPSRGNGQRSAYPEARPAYGPSVFVLAKVRLCRRLREVQLTRLRSISVSTAAAGTFCSEISTGR